LIYNILLLLVSNAALKLNYNSWFSGLLAFWSSASWNFGIVGLRPFGCSLLKQRNEVFKPKYNGCVLLKETDVVRYRN